MTKEVIFIALILALIYLYYQNRKLKRLPATTNSETIFELDEDLIAEKDAALRSKNEAEAEVLSLNNRLKNKQQEVSRKDQEIERLKSEKSQTEIALNAKIKELKEKYSRKSQQLDNADLDSNKLVEKIEQLETQLTEQKQAQQTQLKAINLLFDPQAVNYTQIDFNGLYALLKKFTQSMPGSF